MVAALVGDRHPAQRGANPRDELAQSERLRHVVVGADLETDHRVDLGVARRHHDDRHTRSAAELAADVDAGDLRQHDVEQHERGLGRVEARDRLGTVGRGLDEEPLALQRDRRARRGTTVRRRLRGSGADRPCACFRHATTWTSALGVRLRAPPRRTVRDRQGERERGTFAFARLHGDLATVHLGDVADDREAEAGAAGVAAARPIDAIEPFEDALEVAASGSRCRDRARRARRDHRRGSRRPRPVRPDRST